MSDSEEDFEEQLRQEAIEKEKIAAGQGKTKVDEDGTVMEWDADKKAWFPKIDDDFIANYQMNYGKFDETAKSGEGDETASTAKVDENYQEWFKKSYIQAGQDSRIASLAAAAAGAAAAAVTSQTDSTTYYEYYDYYYKWYSDQAAEQSQTASQQYQQQPQQQPASVAAKQSNVRSSKASSSQASSGGDEESIEEKLKAVEEKTKSEKNDEKKEYSDEDYYKWWNYYYGNQGSTEAGSSQTEPGKASEGGDNTDYSAQWAEYYKHYYGQSQQGEGNEDADKANGGQSGEAQKSDGTQSSDQQGKKKKQSNKSTSWFEMEDKVNTNVYVAGLPDDITFEEFTELMNKCGMIMYDPRTRKPKLKLYRNSDGTLKGDGLCCYIKPESVDLALQILDGYDVKGFKISVEKAKFEQKGHFDPKKRGKKLSNKEKKDLKERQQKLFDWRPEKLSSRMKFERVLIIKNLFNPEEFDRNAALIPALKRDLEEECKKYGGNVRKIVIHDRHPEKCASVTFGEPTEADSVKSYLDGRYFKGRQISVSTWDGKTKYAIQETEEEEKKRLDEWAHFLERGEQKKSTNTETSSSMSKSEEKGSTAESKPAVSNVTDAEAEESRASSKDSQLKHTDEKSNVGVQDSPSGSQAITHSASVSDHPKSGDSENIGTSGGGDVSKPVNVADGGSAQEASQSGEAQSVPEPMETDDAAPPTAGSQSQPHTGQTRSTIMEPETGTKDSGSEQGSLKLPELDAAPGAVAEQSDTQPESVPVSEPTQGKPAPASGAVTQTKPVSEATPDVTQETLTKSELAAPQEKPAVPDVAQDPVTEKDSVVTGPAQQPVTKTESSESGHMDVHSEVTSSDQIPKAKPVPQLGAVPELEQHSEEVVSESKSITQATTNVADPSSKSDRDALPDIHTQSAAESQAVTEQEPTTEVEPSNKQVTDAECVTGSAPQNTKQAVAEMKPVSEPISEATQKTVTEAKSIVPQEEKPAGPDVMQKSVTESESVIEPTASSAQEPVTEAEPVTESASVTQETAIEPQQTQKLAVPEVTHKSVTDGEPVAMQESAAKGEPVIELEQSTPEQSVTEAVAAPGEASPSNQGTESKQVSDKIAVPELKPSLEEPASEAGSVTQVASHAAEPSSESITEPAGSATEESVDKRGSEATQEQEFSAGEVTKKPGPVDKTVVTDEATTRVETAPEQKQVASEVSVPQPDSVEDPSQAPATDKVLEDKPVSQQESEAGSELRASRKRRVPSQVTEKKPEAESETEPPVKRRATRDRMGVTGTSSSSETMQESETEPEEKHDSSHKAVSGSSSDEQQVESGLGQRASRKRKLAAPATEKDPVTETKPGSGQKQGSESEPALKKRAVRSRRGDDVPEVDERSVSEEMEKPETEPESSQTTKRGSTRKKADTVDSEPDAGDGLESEMPAKRHSVRGKKTIETAEVEPEHESDQMVKDKSQSVLTRRGVHSKRSAATEEPDDGGKNEPGGLKPGSRTASKRATRGKRGAATVDTEQKSASDSETKHTSESDTESTHSQRVSRRKRRVAAAGGTSDDSEGQAAESESPRKRARGQRLAADTAPQEEPVRGKRTKPETSVKSESMPSSAGGRRGASATQKKQEPASGPKSKHKAESVPVTEGRQTRGSKQVATRSAVKRQAKK